MKVFFFFRNVVIIIYIYIYKVIFNVFLLILETIILVMFNLLEFTFEGKLSQQSSKRDSKRFTFMIISLRI